jgi:hypothetical protein
MKTMKIITLAAVFALVSASSLHAQEKSSDSFAKAQLEKMKEFKKHRLSK